jgi:cell division protein FtsQ
MELSLPFPRRAQRRRVGRGTLSDTRLWYALDRLRHNRLALHVAVCALAAVASLGGGWLWLRDSSLVSVRHVHITGVHGVEALQVRDALDNAAVRMTTLDFNVGTLRSAVSSFAIIGGLRVTTSFPHTVSISVSERQPVAALLSAGQRTAVAADGTVLGPGLLSSSLPVIDGSVEPSAGTRLREPAALDAVAVLGAAPAALAPFVVRVFNGPEGLTVAMRNGLLAYFGNPMRPHAKWLSLARVLNSPSAAGAWYVDVRLPERPAAGLSSASSSSAATFTPVQSGASDPTAAALAARLATAAGAGSGASGASSTATGSGESESSGGPSSTSRSSESEASAGSSTTSSSGEGEASSSSAASESSGATPSQGG